MTIPLDVALVRSKLRTSGSALTAIQAGWAIASDGIEASCSALLPIYEARYRHLAAQHSSHAKQLAEGISEFLQGLRLHLREKGVWSIVQGAEEYHFLIFCLSTGEAIGCMRVVAQGNVSPVRWGELWNQ